MPPKRKRRVSDISKEHLPRKHLKQTTLPVNLPSAWAWVGTEVVSPSDIKPEHCLIACGLSQRNNYPLCANKYMVSGPSGAYNKYAGANGLPSVENDVINLLDNEETTFLCNARACRTNPNCLNHLGQEKWETEDQIKVALMKSFNTLGRDPSVDTREHDFPIGLKNLGATCYVNASLQVWFRDLTFRFGLYACSPPSGSEEKYKDSPIYQLQVTFAALQALNQRVFNPLKLLESLQLRTSEQQDAQEFSKLFMSHLDEAFKKQANPVVRSLVTDQFQGKQVYVTTCDQCHYRSEKASEFFEIEIHLEKTSKLKDRISAVLRQETLAGDNQYFCPQCQTLQNATRHVELRTLPPVLHFSLLRFVYDVSTMERKKSKHFISFPLTLDMNTFVGPVEEWDSSRSLDDNIYELRGILLHKGPSAYHGHYEAQVYDDLQMSWYQCNDEAVTKMSSPSEKRSVEQILLDIPAERERASSTRGKACDGFTAMIGDQRTADGNCEITSKDAYMLVYTRKQGAQSGALISNLDPSLPELAMDTVNMLNDAHHKACDTYKKMKDATVAKLMDLRAKVTDIYRRWNTQPDDKEVVLVSRQGLEAWLSQYKGTLTTQVAGEGYTLEEGSSGKVVTLDDILCDHGRLSPLKSGNIKRMSMETYHRIANETGWKFEPLLTVYDICIDCMKLHFRECLYRFQHPQHVKEFDEISIKSGGSDHKCEGYWISKVWLKDWRLMKPRMHVTHEEDPAPDSSLYQPDVLCEHQALSLNESTRQKISVGAAVFLQSIHPTWNPVPSDKELCAICDARSYNSKQTKRASQQQAEEEKAILQGILVESISNESALDRNLYAMIPSSFVEAWKQWIEHPTEVPKPSLADTRVMICRHDKLLIDPNCPADLDSLITIIKRSDWETLEKIYSVGPLIAIEKCFQGSENGVQYSHDIPVCEECRVRWKHHWTSTVITIRLEDAPTNSNATLSYLSSNLSGRLRSSKRLSRKREFRFPISQSTTVKEIKHKIQAEFGIASLVQQLSYEGTELTDDTATAKSFRILANGILTVRRRTEVYDVDSDTEHHSRIEERGFEGTLLEGNVDATTTDSSDREGEQPCPQCTFINRKKLFHCEICRASLLYR